MNAPQTVLNCPRPARFTVDEFIRLHETGVFDKYSKSELIEGEIVCMNAQWSPHARIKSDLCVELALALRAIGSPLKPQVEVSVRLDDNSLPEPDIVLTDYRGGGGVALAAVALIVEVSDTTFAIDIGRKAGLYAAAGVPEYWVIHVEGENALLHMEPTPNGYAEQIDVPFGEVLHSETIAGLSVATESMLAS